ncbi:MAG: T9SS type A sorting domain-containing protein [Melioribacteraceae bacterium]|nr:T9SS type A sorting domain-containing protein [Melioribacteraceae bacterium]
MINKRNFVSLTILILFFSSLSFGQDVKRLLPYDGSPGSFIIAQIRADTLANVGNATFWQRRIYELDRGGIYLSTEILTLSAKKTLRIRAAQGTGSKPIIYLFPTGTGANPTRPPGNFAVLNGAHIELTGIAIAGIYEWDTEAIGNMQGGLINTTGVGSRITVDNCIMSNTNGNHIRTGSGSNLVKVTNSIFANMGSLTTSNFGAGKGIDLREVSCDSLILLNSTFVNYQDRVVRHLNLASGNTVTGLLGYCLIDHNTFVNGMGFHGVLSLGNVGKNVRITNNLFLDAYALGEDSLDVTRSVEFNNTGEKYANGNNTMPWIFTAPNDTTKWDVQKNYFSISSAGQSWFAARPRHKEGSPLSNHIKGKLGANAAQAFTKLNSLSFTNAPALMVNLMNYYVSPTGGNYTKDKPGYDWRIHDMDRRTLNYYIDTMNCAYPTSSPAYSGGLKGFPAGDLNWFPSKKAEWIAAGGTSVKQLEGIPVEYALDQNYPNPFNPTTNIRYSLPKAASISLVIYNTLGQKVATLIDSQEQGAGNYNYVWNGKDMNGNNLASGIYFYQLNANDYTITKKMMLLK